MQQVAYLVGAVGAGNQGPLKFEGLAEGEKASWLVDDLFWGKADADDTLWWPLPGGRKTPIGMQPTKRSIYFIGIGSRVLAETTWFSR